MDTVDLIARIVLALVFTVSGIAKLTDIQGSRRAMRAFGVPRPLFSLAAIGLPLAEIAIAVLLIPGATAFWASAAAIALLLGFSVAIAWQLSRGRRPDCHCFGALSGGPIGGKTLARNGALLAIALGVAIVRWDTVVAPNLATDDPAILTAVLLLGVALLLGAGAQVALMYLVYRHLAIRIAELDSVVRISHDRAQRRLAGEIVPPVVGEPAPALELPGLRGATVDLASMRGRELLLVFIRPGCWACHAILPDLIARSSGPPGDGTELVVISRGTPDENGELAELDAPVLLSPNVSVATAFGVGGTPAAIRLDADGKVGSEVALGIDQVRHQLNPDFGLDQEPVPQASPTGQWLRGLTGSTYRLIAWVRSAGA